MKRFFLTAIAVVMLFGIATTDARASEVTEVVTEVKTIVGTGSHGATDGIMAQFNLPRSILVTDDGIYVADTFNNLIRFVNEDGYVTTLAGSVFGLDIFRFPIGRHRDGGIDTALFNRPSDVLMHPSGNLLVLDTMNHSLRIIMEDNVFTFAGNGVAGHGDGSGIDVLFNRPSAMTVCNDGNIFIADSGNHVIRKIDVEGNVTTIAGIAGERGHDDGVANIALFNGPMGIAVDDDGRIFVSDTGNHLIRMIDDGVVTTIAGILLFEDDIVFANAQNANEWGDEPLGGMADGSNDIAMFNSPRGLAIFEDILIVADNGNHRIRAILPDGRVVTMAGGDHPGHEDGMLDVASLHLPEGVHIFGDTLYVIDTGNNVIRKISNIGSMFEE